MTAPLLQTCKTDVAQWCVLYTINWRIITRNTNTQSQGQLWALHHMRWAPGRTWVRWKRSACRRWASVTIMRRRCMNHIHCRNGPMDHNKLVRRSGSEGCAQWMSSSPPNYNEAETRCHMWFQIHMQHRWWQLQYKQRSWPWRWNL